MTDEEAIAWFTHIDGGLTQGIQAGYKLVDMVYRLQRELAEVKETYDTLRDDPKRTLSELELAELREDA